MVAGDVPSWRCKVDCSIASWTEWHCLHSLSLPHSSSSSSSRRLLPLLFFARLLAAQTAQLSSVPPLPQQILHELCVSEWDGTFKGECSLQGQCVCTSSVCPPPLLPVLLCTPLQTLLRIISVKDSSPERPPSMNTLLSIPFYSFSLYSKSCFEIWVCSYLCEEQFAPQRGHIPWCDFKLVTVCLKFHLKIRTWKDFSWYVLLRRIKDQFVQIWTRKMREWDTESSLGQHFTSKWSLVTRW